MGNSLLKKKGRERGRTEEEGKEGGKLVTSFCQDVLIGLNGTILGRGSNE